MAETLGRVDDTADEGAAARREDKLKRVVTPAMLLFFVVGDMVGGGIYALVGEVGAEVGGAIWAAFAFALVLALFTAGSYAELVTKYPRAGGAAAFIHRAFGNSLVTFVVGFAVMMSSITSAATLSRAFGGDYLSELAGDVPTALIGVGLIVLVALVNSRGIAESAKLNIAFTTIELCGLLLVVVIAVAFVGGGDGDPGRAFTLDTSDSAAPFVVLSGAALAFYALIGFEDSVNLAEEAQNPRRSYPRAMFGGILIGGVIYLLVTISASMAVPTDRLAGSDGPLLEVVGLGPLGVNTDIFSVIALFALTNGILINMITASRLLYGMGDQRVIPGLFSRVLPGRRTPVIAIVFSSLIAAALILTGDLADLADVTVMLLLFAFIGVNAAVLRARRDRVEHDHFVVPTAIPVLGILVCIGLLTQQEAKIFGRAGLLLALGLVLWGVNALVVRRTGDDPGREPVT